MNDRKIIIGNWKMKLSLGESITLASTLIKRIKQARIPTEVEIVVCPSYTALDAVSKIVAKSRIHLGAQDVFWNELGPYTGEIAMSMLAEFDCRAVIIGHSERRHYLHETDEIINSKVKAALSAGAVPILCVGETYDQRNQGITDLVIATQVHEGLKGLALPVGQRIIVAYEPVWVIGTGQAIPIDEVEHVAQVIKQALIDLFPSDVVRHQARIIYGGSVDNANINTFMRLPTIHGSLVGTASWQADAFTALLKNC